MPLYFAYGSNMDATALATRCPQARKLGLARLARHRFALMGSGYATVRRDPRAEVHGVLYDLAFRDIPALDRYEEVDAGLYVKAHRPVLRGDGRSCRAMLYVGTDEADGPPMPGYMEAVVSAAQASELAPTYISTLRTFLPGQPSPR